MTALLIFPAVAILWMLFADRQGWVRDQPLEPSERAHRGPPPANPTSQRARHLAPLPVEVPVKERGNQKEFNKVR